MYNHQLLGGSPKLRLNLEGSDHRDYDLVTSWGMILQQFMARTMKYNQQQQPLITTIDVYHMSSENGSHLI